MKYKVWVEIERVDEENNEYETLDNLGFASTAEFDTEEEAIAFAESLNEHGRNWATGDGVLA